MRMNKRRELELEQEQEPTVEDELFEILGKYLFLADALDNAGLENTAEKLDDINDEFSTLLQSLENE